MNKLTTSAGEPNNFSYNMYFCETKISFYLSFHRGEGMKNYVGQFLVKTKLQKAGKQYINVSKASAPNKLHLKTQYKQTPSFFFFYLHIVLVNILLSCHQPVATALATDVFLINESEDKMVL